MSCVLLSLLVLHSLHVSAAVLVFQSPPSVKVTPGSNVTITCDVSQMTGQCSDVVWLHVGPLKSLSVLHQDSMLRQRGMRCNLSITSARPQDSGRYYCSYLNGPMLLLGNGTTLTVTEPVIHSPVLDLLAPSDRPVNSSSPIPLLCLISGLQDPSQAKVDWELEEMDNFQELTPRVLSETEAGVIGVQVYIHAETWANGATVSCVLSVGDLRIKKSISSMMGMPSQCVLSIFIVGSVCVVLFIVTMTLTILLSWQRKRAGRSCQPSLQSETRGQVTTGVYYATLRFDAAGRRNIDMTK